MCVGTESKLYQVIIPFLPREWMLDARGRVLGSSLREIRCRINWRESLSTVKVTKVDQRNWGKNWEGFAVSFGTHESFGGHVSVALATTSSVAWLEPLAVLAKRLPPLDLTILCYKEFSSTSSSRLFLLYQFDDTGAFVRLGNFRIKFSTIIIIIFNI